MTAAGPDALAAMGPSITTVERPWRSHGQLLLAKSLS